MTIKLYLQRQDFGQDFAGAGETAAPSRQWVAKAASQTGSFASPGNSLEMQTLGFLNPKRGAGLGESLMLGGV